MIPNPAGIEVFLAIVRDGSLAAAAKSLGLGPPAISHRLKSLEHDLGVELLTRTTRSIDLTAAGRVLLERAGPAMQELASAVENARAAGRSTTGEVRLSIPWSAYKIIVAPVLSDFSRQFPDIVLEFSFDERLVDIVRSGFHAGFRLGDRLADGMIATRLTPDLKGAHCATPCYLDERGRPLHPRDLLEHKCIGYRYGSANRIAEWHFDIDGRRSAIVPSNRLVFDGFSSVVQAMKDGHGIGWSLRAVVEDELAEGVLEIVLEECTAPYPPFYIYYPEQNRRFEPLRLFVDFLQNRQR